jgi:hypothetical protein
MTLYIAAISRKEATIVTVSDLMLSTDYTSIESRVLKVEPTTPQRRWIMMFAGAPSPASAFYRELTARLQGKDETEVEVRTNAEEVYREEVRKKIEAEILSPYGIDRATFLRRGRAWFGDEEFLRILYQINNCKLEIELLFAGFEPNGWPRIFSVDDPGSSVNHERTGFHAIGSGYLRALASLYTHYEAGLSKKELIYRMCEAKFLGEIALGVGRKTYMLSFSSSGDYESMYPEDVEEVRAIWDQKGKPPIPVEAIARITQKLRTTKWQKPTEENPIIGRS